MSRQRGKYAAVVLQDCDGDTVDALPIDHFDVESKSLRSIFVGNKSIHFCANIAKTQSLDAFFLLYSMTELTIQAAQADMRRAYLWGAPGVFASGLVWLMAGVVAAQGTEKAAVLALLFGGAAIHPLGILIAKLLGHSGKHAAGNALAVLAGESTVWLIAGCGIAYGMHVLRIEWFFPAMLLIIGGRYLTFHTLFGLRVYWICGALLCAGGLVLALTRAPAIAGAFTGAAIELLFAAIIYMQAKRGGAAS